MGEEQRKFPRLNMSVTVYWEKVADDTSPSASGVTRDISAGGISMILNDKVKVGDVLDLELNLADGKVIQTKGRIVWVETFNIIGSKNEVGYEGGIEFLEMSEETKKELGHFIFNLFQKGK